MDRASDNPKNCVQYALNSLGHTGISCKESPGTHSHHDQLWCDISLVLIKLQKPFWYRWNQAEKIYWFMLPININFHWSKSHNCYIAKFTIVVRVQHLFGCFLLRAVVSRDPLMVVRDPLKIWWRGPWDPKDFQPSRSPANTKLFIECNVNIKWLQSLFVYLSIALEF